MTAPALDDARLVREEVRPGPRNMALDEVAARTAAATGRATVRVYSWEPSTLSLGYAQDADTVDWDFCDREGIGVTRRPTGGGGIYHDRTGDVSYSIAVPADAVPGELAESYHVLLEPLFDALDELGVDAALADVERPCLHDPACYLLALDPAHDVAVDGRKLSGNAQHRTRDAVVQHGSVSVSRDPERHLDCFAAPGVTPAQFHDRVTSLRAEADVTRERAVSVLEDALADWADADEGAWTDEELASASTLAAEKYASDSWIRDREAN